jgi:hypothetical protein
MATRKRTKITVKKRSKARKSNDYFRKKPKLASALIVASGLIALIVSIAIGVTAFRTIPYLSLVDFGAGVIIAVAIIASGMNTYTKDKKVSEKWAVIALILYIIEFPAAWGLGVGFVIALVGTILALRHGQ